MHHVVGRDDEPITKPARVDAIPEFARLAKHDRHAIGRDRDKLDQYLTGVRELETRIEDWPDERVVVISTAHGLKFSDFKIAYHESRLEGISSEHTNPPVLIPPSYGAVMDAINARLQVMV